MTLIDKAEAHDDRTPERRRLDNWSAENPRDQAAQVAIAAWLNTTPDKLPKEMRLHTCAATKEAWARVVDAIAALTLPDDEAGKVLEGVTDGPWEAVFDRQTWGWLEVDGPSFKIGAPTRATDLSLADEVQRKKDARFIAWCRTGVPALLARITADAERIKGLEAERDEAIRAERQTYRDAAEVSARAEAAEARIAALTAQVERQRGALESIAAAKPQQIGDTGFQQGPLALWQWAQRVARAAITEESHG